MTSTASGDNGGSEARTAGPSDRWVESLAGRLFWSGSRGSVICTSPAGSDAATFESKASPCAASAERPAAQNTAPNMTAETANLTVDFIGWPHGCGARSPRTGRLSGARERVRAAWDYFEATTCGVVLPTGFATTSVLFASSAGTFAPG